ncbi:hypothetical protein PRIPAC_96366 [Pristionchus pacificus]|uniref:Uncharacterized protein n=1 Tax=Pristionchus pacificus TaxID=54126 RepID=A0A2A6CUA8_PRIPA|nr:hypothetical protein PRIPAC_96366 [Pristionchus pacificus]|eukprot:PDM81637.1 hypothetical protein PRIPAC_30618 [Pristionchus pacificus]
MENLTGNLTFLRRQFTGSGQNCPSAEVMPMRRRAKKKRRREEVFGYIQPEESIQIVRRRKTDRQMINGMNTMKWFQRNQCKRIDFEGKRIERWKTEDSAVVHIIIRILSMNFWPFADQYFQDESSHQVEFVLPNRSQYFSESDHSIENVETSFARHWHRPSRMARGAFRQGLAVLKNSQKAVMLRQKRYKWTFLGTICQKLDRAPRIEERLLDDFPLDSSHRLNVKAMYNKS